MKPNIQENECRSSAQMKASYPEFQSDRVKASNLFHRESARENAHLLQISESIAQVEFIEDLRVLIAGKIEPLFNFEGCALFLVSPNQKTHFNLMTHSIAAGEEWTSGIASEWPHVSHPGSVIEWIMGQVKDAGKPLLFDQGELRQLFPKSPGLSYRSGHDQLGDKKSEKSYFLAANLSVRDEEVGVFWLSIPQRITFPTRTFSLFAAVVRLISTALAKISKHEALTRYAKEQDERVVQLGQSNEALARTSARLVQQPELPAFLHQVVLEMVQLLDADAGHCSLFYPETDTLQTIAHYDAGQPAGEIGIDKPRPAREALCWQILKSLRRPRYFDLRYEADLFWRRAVEYHREHDHQTVWGVPLFAGNEPLGHLGFAFHETNPSHLPQSDVLAALAHQAALAIQMARLGERNKAVAIVGAQKRAAEEHKAELARANDGLRRGAGRLAQAATTEAVMESFLLEAIAVSGASSGSLLQHVQGTQFRLRFWADAGQEHAIYSDSVWESADALSSLDRDGFGVMRRTAEGDVVPVAVDNIGWNTAAANASMDRDAFGIMKRIAQGEVMPIAVNAELEAWFPESFNFYRECGIGFVWHFPFQVDGQVNGCLTLNYSTELSPVLSETVFALVQALTLALQASLALQALHLIEEINYKAQEAAVLEERNRIAREIHDTMAQAFTGVSTHLEAARALVPEDSKAKFHIERAGSAAREGLREARRSVRALRPRTLEGSNLCGALQKMVADCEHSTPPKVEFAVLGQPFPLALEVEDDLLRIGQEGVINAIRHGAARSIGLELQFSAGQVTLAVRDDGRGFDSNLNGELSGFGLIGIRERIIRMNGKLDLKSAPGKGTEIVVTVPVLKLTSSSQTP